MAAKKEINTEIGVLKLYEKSVSIDNVFLYLKQPVPTDDPEFIDSLTKFIRGIYTLGQMNRSKEISETLQKLLNGKAITNQ